MGEAQHQAVLKATQAAQKIMTAAGDSVRTPRKLTGSKSKSNAWGVRYKEFTSVARPQTVVFFWGAPPYWRERGTSAHFITSRYLTGSRNSRGLKAARNSIGAGRLLGKKDGNSNDSRAVLHFPDGGYATKVAERGVQPRPFWEPTKRAVADASAPIYRTENWKALLTAGFN